MRDDIQRAFESVQREFERRAFQFMTQAAVDEVRLGSKTPEEIVRNSLSTDKIDAEKFRHALYGPDGFLCSPDRREEVIKIRDETRSEEATRPFLLYVCDMLPEGSLYMVKLDRWGEALAAMVEHGYAERLEL